MSDQLENQTATAPAVVKLVNYLAASMGIGTFLGFVNVAVGLLSAVWLATQLYGYLAHELPMKRMRKQLLQRQLGRSPASGSDESEAGE